MGILLKWFLVLGGAGLLWGFVSKGVPQIIAWLMPVVVALVHRFMRWLLAKPAIHAAAVKYRPQIEETLKALVEGFKQIFDAAEKAVEEDLDKADGPPPA